MQCAHLQQPVYTGGLHRRDYRFGDADEHALEAAAVVAGLIEDADQVDHGVGVGEGVTEEADIGHVAFAQ